MSNIKKNLGHVTAYAYYKAGGGTMAEEEFTEYMADFGDAAERAVDAASEAAQSKADAQTAAATATDKADEAAASASSASGSAASAAEDASTASTAANTATGAATTATSAKNDAVSAKNAAQTAQAAAESAAAYSDVRMSVDQFVFHADADGVVQKAQTQKLEIYPYKGNQRLRTATMNGTGLDLSLVDPVNEGASIMLPFWPSTVSTWGQIKVTMSVAVGDQFEANQITKEGTIAITAKDTAGNTYSFSKAFTIVIIRDGADGTVTTEQMDAAIDEAIEPLKEDFSKLDDIVQGENVIDFSTILSNNNTAISNNGDGTYTVGTTDYGTTVFGSQITLTKGKYLLNSVPNGRMVVSRTTNPTDDNAIYLAYANPLVFELTENLECYLCFRMDGAASTSFTFAPYIKKIGIKTSVEQLVSIAESRLSDLEDISSLYLSDTAITTNIDDGTVVDITPISTSSFATALVPCKAGDKFFVSGHGGQNYLLWAFTNKSLVKLNGSTRMNISSGTVLTATEDGYFISSVNKTYTYSLAVKRYSKADPEVVQVVNPHDLSWQMGQFTSTGVQGGTFVDRMYTIIKVKAGSIILAPNQFGAYGTNVKVGYYLGEPTGEMDYYAGFNFGAFKITQDCTLYLGVMYNVSQRILKASLLDNIHISLLVENFEPKDKKSHLANYGEPPSPAIYYEGQHIDTTGWTNESVDVNAIHTAYDALVTASNGYLTKKDLGEVWNGYHYYEYSTNPVGLHVAGLKVPKVLVTCEMHGNEKMSTYAMHYLLYDLIHNPQKNPILSYLRANVQLVVIPITNPWGYINTSRWNENGVNLNRNFPTYDWADYDEGDDSAIGGINYKGESAGSEVETKMMIDFMNSHPDASLMIDLHTNGTDTSAWYEVTSTMLACTDDETDPSYSIQRKYLDASKMQVNYVKPWCDSVYGTDLGNVYYGAVTVWNDEPYISEWVTEFTNTLGITFEVMAGSSNSYLGNKLTKYSPDAIKCSAEIFGNYILAMLHIAKDN